MIIYNKKNGFIDAIVPNLDYAYNYPEEIKKNLRVLNIDNIPKDIFKYKVVNGKLTKMSKQEIFEKQKYSRVLTDEERQLNKLKPSLEEIKKAEQTIEILTLIQEVI